MKTKLGNLTYTALLSAIIIIMGLVPPYIGYIKVPPIEVTLLCIPVIIGTITLGLRGGLILAFIFAITSFLQIFLSPLGLFGKLLLSIDGFKTILLIFLPRLLIPVFTYYTYKLLKTKYEVYIELFAFVVFTMLGIFVKWTFFIPAIIIIVIIVFFKNVNPLRLDYGIAALVGSLTNTVFFLLSLFILFKGEPRVTEISAIFGTDPQGLIKAYSAIGMINGIPEAIVALLVCIPILYALDKAGLNKNEVE
jgi:uncharacterized membrane protein